MIEDTAVDYAKYPDIDLAQKLDPINNAIDQMITRLEEFESILLLVQQERCESMGLTGHLVDTADCVSDLKDLCLRIDAVENLVAYIKNAVQFLEIKIDAAETEFGIKEASKLKNFFKPLFEKKSSLSEKSEVASVAEENSTTFECDTSQFFKRNDPDVDADTSMEVSTNNDTMAQKLDL